MHHYFKTNISFHILSSDKHCCLRTTSTVRIHVRPYTSSETKTLKTGSSVVNLGTCMCAFAIPVIDPVIPDSAARNSELAKLPTAAPKQIQQCCIRAYSSSDGNAEHWGGMSSSGQLCGASYGS